MTTSEQVNEIAAACAKAQAAMKPATKDAKNPHFNSKYSDLAAIIEATKVYAAQGVAIFQDATVTEAGASVTTRLMHSSGQWLEFGPLIVPFVKRDAHGTGSATTYAKRYGLQAAALIPSDDDDGNAATEQARPAAVTKAPDGFDNWLADLEAVAVEGEAALKSAWTKSQPFMRKYLTDTDNAKWESLKAKSAKVKVPVTA